MVIFYVPLPLWEEVLQFSHDNMYRNNLEEGMQEQQKPSEALRSILRKK